MSDLQRWVEDTRLEAKAEDSLSEDRTSRGQGQECSRPRTKDTSASVLHKKKGLHKNFSGDLQKKKGFTKIFQAISMKKRFPKNFSSDTQNFNNSKNSAVLEPRTGQFSRTRGQGLQNLSSRPKTSSRTPPLMIWSIGGSNEHCLQQYFGSKYLS